MYLLFCRSLPTAPYLHTLVCCHSNSLCWWWCCRHIFWRMGWAWSLPVYSCRPRSLPSQSWLLSESFHLEFLGLSILDLNIHSIHKYTVRSAIYNIKWFNYCLLKQNKQKVKTKQRFLMGQYKTTCKYFWVNPIFKRQTDIYSINTRWVGMKSLSFQLFDSSPTVECKHEAVECKHEAHCA